LDIVQVIISKLFIFRKSDLEAWEEDPETWESQERNEGQAWEWAVRPCAERLLIDLLTHHRELGQPLLTYCNLATKVQMDIVTKEAAYCALGCAASIVHESFDFDRFLNATLVADTQIQEPMAKLLRRRIAILLSQWIAIKIPEGSRPVVYEIYRHILNPNDDHNDLVVRITAARQFKWIAEDFGFTGEDFLPFAADYFTLLVGLIKEVESDEARLAILSTIRVIVNGMGQHVSQFGTDIMVVLPTLWETVGPEEYMMKQAILAVMSSLIDAIGLNSLPHQPTIIPLLREAMNPDSALHLHLIEDSIELWSSVMQQCTPPLLPELAQLVELLLPLLEYDSHVANRCLEITKDYIILAPGEILSDHLRRPTIEALGKTLNVPSREQNRLGAECLERVVRIAEDLGVAQGLSIVIQDMFETGLLRTLLERLHSAWESTQTVGPSRKPSKIDSLKETDYFAILARIALADPALFVNMLSSFSGSFEQPWSWLSTQWFANFDCIAEADKKKLSCLALTRLCELPSPVQELILARLQDYLSMWTSVITDLREPTEASNTDTLIWKPREAYSAAEFEGETPLMKHEYMFAEKDPVHRVNTYDFVRARLEDLVSRVGGEQAFEANWAVNVDKDVLAGFQRLSQPGEMAQDEMGH